MQPAPPPLVSTDMFALITLIAFCFVCVAATVALKLAFKIILLPLKLLFLPILAIVVLVKFAVLFALGIALIAVLIPLAILFAIFVGPFLLLSALT